MGGIEEARLKPDTTLQVDDLQLWSLSTFRTTSFMIALVISQYLAGSLQDRFKSLGTGIGLLPLRRAVGVYVADDQMGPSCSGRHTKDTPRLGATCHSDDRRRRMERRFHFRPAGVHVSVRPHEVAGRRDGRGASAGAPCPRWRNRWCRRICCRRLRRISLWHRGGVSSRPQQKDLPVGDTVSATINRVIWLSGHLVIDWEIDQK